MVGPNLRDWAAVQRCTFAPWKPDPSTDSLAARGADDALSCHRPLRTNSKVNSESGPDLFNPSILILSLWMRRDHKLPDLLVVEYQIAQSRYVLSEGFGISAHE